jgi:hypothetical protein
MLPTRSVAAAFLSILCLHSAAAESPAPVPADWLPRWEKKIVADSGDRYCDKAMGEDLGWLMSPFLDGYYYGYLATKDTKWVERLIDWTDAWVKRAVTEPDGFPGWPMEKSAGTEVDKLNQYTADSLLGEAMALRPIVLMAHEILSKPALKGKYGEKAASYLRLAEQLYEKWDKRGGWRETRDGGAISVTLPYGLDGATGKWREGYDQRNAPGAGFSHPDNKANLVARWMLAMADSTGKPIYKTRATQWFRVMKSRLKPKGDGYEIWNYWEPAGAWDAKPDGSPKHWVGVHPNGGYYSVDVEAMVDAHEHGVVFDQADVARLVATALAEKRAWAALAPFNAEIRAKVFRELKPDSWGGLGQAPKVAAGR